MTYEAFRGTASDDPTVTLSTAHRLARDTSKNLLTQMQWIHDALVNGERLQAIGAAACIEADLDVLRAALRVLRYEVRR